MGKKKHNPTDDPVMPRARLKRDLEMEHTSDNGSPTVGGARFFLSSLASSPPPMGKLTGWGRQKWRRWNLIGMAGGDDSGGVDDRATVANHG
jgi:hypothetical protein